MKNLFMLIPIFLLTLSCVTTTTIKAVSGKNKVDKDVKIYVDGEYLGNGEATYFGSRAVYFAVPFLELKKESCKTHREKLDTQTGVAAIFGFGAIAAGAGIFGREKSQKPAGLVIQQPDLAGSFSALLTLVGSISLLQSREYVPVQNVHFQCLKVSSE